MWTPVSVPYTRPRADTAEKLPTASEIRDYPVEISRRTGERIVALPFCVIKYGAATKVREGQAMLYLEDCAPEVPTPRLLSMFQDSEEFFIIMERVPGRTLDQEWDSLSETEKDEICSELKAAFASMRNQSCPWSDHYGAVDGGAVPHHLFWTREQDHSINGPFQGEAAFNTGLVKQYIQMQEMNDRVPYKGDFYASHLGEVLHGHRPTLTHAYVQRKNIIKINHASVDVPTHLRSCRVAIIDWEDAGWYPDYWEYFTAFCSLRWDNDWCIRLEEFIKAWPAETAVMEMVYRDLFF